MKNQEKVNNYDKLTNIMYSILSGCTEINSNERELVTYVADYISQDRNNKIIKYIIENHASLNNLISTIDNLIEEAIDDDMIDRLNILKSEINSFIDNQKGTNKVLENKIIDNSINSILFDTFAIPTYYGKSIASKNYYSADSHELHEDVVHKLYDLMENNSELYDEINKGINIKINITKYEDVFNKCSYALSYRDKLYKNLDTIIEYNSINRELNNALKTQLSKKYICLSNDIKKIDNLIDELKAHKLTRAFSKRRLILLEKEKDRLLELKNDYDKKQEILMDIHIRLGKINNKLEEEGLLSLITKSDYKYLTNREDSSIDICDNIRNINSKEDLDNYYSSVLNQFAGSKLLLDENKKLKEEFYENASSEAINLIEEDRVTAFNISRLNNRNGKNGINPSLAIYVLETMLVARDTDLENMNVSEDEYNSVKHYYDKLINERLDVYNTKLVDILSSKKQFIKR